MPASHPSPLPPRFEAWFARRGWTARPHQIELLALARAGRSALLVAPTGAGKTLAGFLPTLVDLAEGGGGGLHTLYISPLKALAVDIARNLEAPIAEMGLPVRVETRTGDTSAHKRARQIERPPDILLTTPEQLALLIAHREAAELFSGLRRVVLDELHSLVTSKRGDLLSLGLARLRRLAPGLVTVGLSATVREPEGLRRYLVGQGAAPADPDPDPAVDAGDADDPSPPLRGRDGEGGAARQRRATGPARDEADRSVEAPLLHTGAPPSAPAGHLPHKGGEGAHARLSEPPGGSASDAGEPSPPLWGRDGEGGAARKRRPTAAAKRSTDQTVAAPAPGAPTSRRHPPPAPSQLADLVVVAGGAPPAIHILDGGGHLPLAGHTAGHAMGAIYDLIRRHRTTLVFVNTRLQAEHVFQSLWTLNDDGLAIALHHGSLDVTQRRRVEAAMVEGSLRAVVCTATLDLGIDWGDVDLVVNVGAPKGASRLMQRIGRSNHRMDEPSQAYLVPANRFEVLECQAALDAVEAAAQDTPDPRPGGLDVLAQHVLGMACAGGFTDDELYAEVTGAAPYAGLSRADFDAVLAFVATGGYALKAYERFAKIVRGPDGLWRVRDGRMAQAYRMNIGTIVESSMIKVRLGRSNRTRPGTVLPRGGRVLGEIEEYFAETLTPGDTFLFGGEVLEFHGIQEDEVLVTRARAGTDPKIPSYAGGKFPLSTFLAEGVRGLIADPFEWDRLPRPVVDWLVQQRRRSRLPGRRDLLVETFPRFDRHYLVAYPFEGRLAHQTLGMLLTRRLERARLKPLGFVANDYGLAVWGLRDLSARAAEDPDFLADLFGQDMLGDDLEEWLAESALMKRTFRQCAVIAGLIERNFPGQKKTGRQVTVSTDLVYDVLRRHEPGHVLLRAARADAATGLLDIERLGGLLRRIEGHIVHKALPRVSPLGVSIMLEIGRERVYGEAADEILAQAEAELLGEALG